MRRKILIAIDILIGAATIVLAGCGVPKKMPTSPAITTSAEPEKKRYAQKFSSKYAKISDRFTQRKIASQDEEKNEPVVVVEEEKTETVLDTTNMLQDILIEAEQYETRGSYCAYGPPTPRN